MKKSGFSIVELLIILVVFCVMGWLGYMLFVGRDADTSSLSNIATDVQEAPAVTSASDLGKAEEVLNEADIDQNDDLTQLESELDQF